MRSLRPWSFPLGHFSSRNPASKASERGRLHPALPVEGATQAPIIEIERDLFNQVSICCESGLKQILGIFSQN